MNTEGLAYYKRCKLLLYTFDKLVMKTITAYNHLKHVMNTERPYAVLHTVA